MFNAAYLRDVCSGGSTAIASWMSVVVSLARLRLRTLLIVDVLLIDSSVLERDGRGTRKEVLLCLITGASTSVSLPSTSTCNENAELHSETKSTYCLQLRERQVNVGILAGRFHPY